MRGQVIVVAESSTRTHYGRDGFTLCGRDYRWSRHAWEHRVMGTWVTCRKCRLSMEHGSK